MAQEENQSDLSFCTTNELLDALKQRYQACVFYGVPNEGEDHDSHTSYKGNGAYEILGLLSACAMQVDRIARGEIETDGDADE